MSTQLAPLVSEKSVALAEAERTYVFAVPKNANKLQVAKAISEQFKVKVASVRTVIAKGKAKGRLVQRGAKRVSGKRSDIKKAYVKLAEGESIKLFEEKK